MYKNACIMHIYTETDYVSAPWLLNATLKTVLIPFPSIPSTLCEMKWFSASLIITVAIKPLALLLSFLSISPHLYPSMLSSPSSLLHALVNLPQDSLSCILKSAGFTSLSCQSKQWETSACGWRSLERTTGRGRPSWTGLAYARVP